MQHDKQQVVAAIIARNGRFLVGKRSLHKTSAPGTWCTVTGRIEPGETEKGAALREVLEETGLHVELIGKVCETGTRNGRAHIHWWLVAPIDDSPARLANDEHSELRWVTVEEMYRLEPVFAEDVEIFARLGGRPHASAASATLRESNAGSRLSGAPLDVPVEPVRRTLARQGAATAPRRNAESAPGRRTPS